MIVIDEEKYLEVTNLFTIVLHKIVSEKKKEEKKNCSTQIISIL